MLHDDGEITVTKVSLYAFSWEEISAMLFPVSAYGPQHISYGIVVSLSFELFAQKRFMPGVKLSTVFALEHIGLGLSQPSWFMV